MSADASQTSLKGYAASIAKATKVTDPEVLALIEDDMRVEHRTLDHLDRRRFNRAALQSASNCIALGAIAACDYAAALAS